jgi:hypothetical protein
MISRVLSRKIYRWLSGAANPRSSEHISQGAFLEGLTPIQYTPRFLAAFGRMGSPVSPKCIPLPIKYAADLKRAQLESVIVSIGYWFDGTNGEIEGSTRKDLTALTLVGFHAIEDALTVQR